MSIAGLFAAFAVVRAWERERERERGRGEERERERERERECGVVRSRVHRAAAAGQRCAVRRRVVQGFDG